MVGAEVGGALKNVIAIAIGMVVALELGDNARAALITRGLAEIARLGVALGGSASTFAGLAGLGDLLATAMSPQSRNRTLGERIGGGMTLAEAQADTPNVVEGVETTRVVLELARVGRLDADQRDRSDGCCSKTCVRVTRSRLSWSGPRRTRPDRLRDRLDDRDGAAAESEDPGVAGLE